MKATPAIEVPPDVAVPQPSEVRKYLTEHAELAAVVPIVCQLTRAEFGDDAQLSLEVYRDPEFADHYLALYVLFPAYHPSILPRIDAIWDKVEERGVDVCGMSGWMIINPDFRAKARHAV